ncbi:hypothetical protein [Rhodobacter calidifons]|uniref:Uncharacterized protein n=1 Tax=Rhodobacter calidifons TaxID=2715277 RepID=A0ABX0G8P1_9RHOB|nr:hypothetical protein [Rhodobacter calidifons]NHB77591.1 hypothetical protein [Rhodobacter calidifons]
MAAPHPERRASRSSGRDPDRERERQGGPGGCTNAPCRVLIGFGFAIDGQDETGAATNLPPGFVAVSPAGIDDRRVDDPRVLVALAASAPGQVARFAACRRSLAERHPERS